MPLTRQLLVLRALAPAGALERAVLARAALRVANRATGGRLGRLEARAARRVDLLFDRPYAEWLARYQPVEASSPVTACGTIAAILVPGGASALQLARCLRSLRAQDLALARIVAVAPSRDRRLRLAAWLAGERNLELAPEPDDADADCVLLLRGAPLLRRRAAGTLAAALEARSDLVAAYADEDRGLGGVFRQPFFKPDFSPILGRQHDYVGNVAMFRPDFFRDHVAPDLAGGSLPSWLAATPRHAVAHVPEILHAEPGPRRLSYLSGNAFDHALAAAARQDALPSVAIVIPTRDRGAMLQECIESVEATTEYDRSKLSLVIVDNGSSEPEACRLLQALARDPSITVLDRPGAFNYAKLANAGAAASGDAEILVFLNNDITIRDREWLLKLVGALALPSAGIVGCKLLYPDGRVQHAGVVTGLFGAAGHLGVGAGAEDGVYFELANHTREISAVTGALTAMRASLFRDLGGYDERLAVGVNDIALCLACNDVGRQTFYLQSALAFHLESASRGFDDTDEKWIRLLAECRLLASARPELKYDPFYSPNLSLTKLFEFADPPRRILRPPRERALTVLMLTATFEAEHPLGKVVALMAHGLEARGCTVLIGAPMAAAETPWPAERRLDVTDPGLAARLAVQHGADIVIAHAYPSYDVFKVLPEQIVAIAFDHGEAPPALFRDAGPRRVARGTSLLAMCYADRVLAASEAVRAASPLPRCTVLDTGNGHLPGWGEGSGARRQTVRAARFWAGQLVVLAHCRFVAAERAVEGVDQVVALRRAFELAHPGIAAATQFVLAWWGPLDEIPLLAAAGFAIVPDPAADWLLDLHHAADVFVSLGSRPGYDFGIGQALALGATVIATEPAAYRRAGVEGAASLADAVACLVRAFGKTARRAETGGSRQAVREGEGDCAERLMVEIDEALATKRVRPESAPQDAPDSLMQGREPLQQPA